MFVIKTYIKELRDICCLSVQHDRLLCEVHGVHRNRYGVCRNVVHLTVTNNSNTNHYIECLSRNQKKVVNVFKTCSAAIRDASRCKH